MIMGNQQASAAPENASLARAQSPRWALRAHRQQLADDLALPRKLRVLAFGDSLTAGYYNWGRAYSPYANKLGAQLTAACNAGKYGDIGEVEIIEAGVPGECVLQGMDVRLPSMLGKPDGDSGPFDVVVVLGGTNDIGYGREAGDIARGVCGLVDTVQSFGAMPFVLSIPECHAAAKPDSRAERVRRTVNERLREYCAEEGHGVYVDLSSEIRYVDDSLDQEQLEALREAIFDDGLHLRPQGYDTMGDLVFAALDSFLVKHTIKSE